jgi:hypothetical protein
MQEYVSLAEVKNRARSWQQYTEVKGTYALVGIAVSSFADKR